MQSVSNKVSHDLYCSDSCYSVPPPSTQYGNNKMNVLQSHPFLSIDLCVLEYVLVQILPTLKPWH